MTEDGVVPETAYLAGGAWSALLTADGYRPFARSGPATLPAWVGGWLSSELPLLRVAVEAVATAGLVGRRGWPRTARGRLGLGLTALSWAGLAGLHSAAGRSGAVAGEALVNALGADYVDRIAPALAPPPAPKMPVAQLLVPNHGARRRLVRAADVAYGDGGDRHTLDVWHRPGLPAGARAPVLLQVHGGAWVSGNKNSQALPLLTWLADSGWVCVVMNYRLSPGATWPDHIVDVKRAIAWIRRHIADYGGDPGFVAITGGSAGGHLAALAALTPGDPEYQPGFAEADTSVQAAVPLYGVYDMANQTGTGRDDMIGFLSRLVFKVSPRRDPERWRRASPVFRVGTDAPPTFVVHGANDSLVPVEEARRFVGELRAVSRQPVVYAELPFAQHAYDLLGTVRNSAALHAVACFLAYAASVHRAAPPPPLP
jgi:acetyl esterase/lipase